MLKLCMKEREAAINMKVYAIYFSPTGSTETIVKVIANEFGNYHEFDLSKREQDFHQNFAQDDGCIIDVPSYGGRVPSVALERIKNFQGNNTKAILVGTQWLQSL